jgi:hypothetical protein
MIRQRGGERFVFGGSRIDGLRAIEVRGSTIEDESLRAIEVRGSKVDDRRSRFEDDRTPPMAEAPNPREIAVSSGLQYVVIFDLRSSNFDRHLTSILEHRSTFLPPSVLRR